MNSDPTATAAKPLMGWSFRVTAVAVLASGMVMFSLGCGKKNAAISTTCEPSSEVKTHLAKLNSASTESLLAIRRHLSNLKKAQSASFDQLKRTRTRAISIDLEGESMQSANLVKDSAMDVHKAQETLRKLEVEFRALYPAESELRDFCTANELATFQSYGKKVIREIMLDDSTFLSEIREKSPMPEEARRVILMIGMEEIRKGGYKQAFLTEWPEERNRLTNAEKKRIMALRDAGNSGKLPGAGEAEYSAIVNYELRMRKMAVKSLESLRPSPTERIVRNPAVTDNVPKKGVYYSTGLKHAQGSLMHLGDSNEEAEKQK